MELTSSAASPAPARTSTRSKGTPLKQTRVVVFGMGGIGTNVCMALAELGVGHVTAVDFDRVELKNLNRQVLYSTPAVGRPKVEVAAQRMKAIRNPDIGFTAVEMRISSVEDVESILDQASPDYVFCLADKPNGWIDFWINEGCVRRGIPYSAGAVTTHVGTAYSVLPGTGPCYRCVVDGETNAIPNSARSSTTSAFTT